MEKKQTAVQWLLEELRKPYSDKYIADISNKALAMEREQIEEAFDEGDCNGTFETINRKQYYTQTFKP